MMAPWSGATAPNAWAAISTIRARMGLANVYAALDAGVRRFDASIGGLGGCPFAPGASGNVATEDVVMMLQQMGFDTGIDLPELLQASRLATELTGTAPGGRAMAWMSRYLAPAEGAGPGPADTE